MLQKFLLQKKSGENFSFYKKEEAVKKMMVGDKLFSAIRNDLAELCGYGLHYHEELVSVNLPEYPQTVKITSRFDNMTSEEFWNDTNEYLKKHLPNSYT